MSVAHYSKCLLNTYASTPYFRAHTSKDYPLYKVLSKCRTFRRLPSNLRKLSEKAKEWASRYYEPKGHPDKATGIEGWYDEEGYELNPDTGERLTDEQIEADWERGELDEELDNFEVEDIPTPDGGFADPNTWEESEYEEESDEDGIDEAQLLKDILSHGREWVARDYGVSEDDIGSDGELVRRILDKIAPQTKAQ